MYELTNLQKTILEIVSNNPAIMVETIFMKLEIPKGHNPRSFARNVQLTLDCLVKLDLLLVSASDHYFVAR